MNREKGFAQVLVVLIIVILVGLVYFLGTQKNKPNSVVSLGTPIATQTSNQITSLDQNAVKSSVNNFYTALANQDGKTLFSLMTPPTTVAEKNDYSWLTGTDTTSTPSYRVFIREKINNQKITNIQKQSDDSYLVSITDQQYGYSNAGTTVGYTAPQTRNGVTITAVNIGNQWFVDKYTDQNYMGNPGNAPTPKYNGFGQ